MMFWIVCVRFFFFKQKTAYEMRISDWSSDVCSSDLTFTCGSRWSRTLAPLPSRWLRRTTSSTAWPVAAWALQDSAVERSEPAKPRDRMTWAILTTFYPASIPSPAQRHPRDLVAKACVQGPRRAHRTRSEGHQTD